MGLNQMKIALAGLGVTALTILAVTGLPGDSDNQIVKKAESVTTSGIGTGVSTSGYWRDSGLQSGVSFTLEQFLAKCSASNDVQENLQIDSKNAIVVAENVSKPAITVDSVSSPAVQQDMLSPTPQPNAQIMVAATEPEKDTEKESTANDNQGKNQTVEIPVRVGFDTPGQTTIDRIEINPETIPTPAPTATTMPPSQNQMSGSDNQPVFSQTEQMASIQTGTTSIMGSSYTYLEQMVRYYMANKAYPAFYADTDAPTIEEFCRIYMEEAQAEGVRVEVAFCQAMKETGFLTFTGDVDIDQFNFAGIGATGGGVKGNYFGNVRAGVRAQIQHLKAYASTEALSTECIDPRFQYVKRGTTPYVEWLGIQENPNGGGWAAAKNYGPSIINDYIAKLFSY